ncbi:transposase [Gordonia oryzae]|uniref:Transposase n=1 Tax=Gordonia oryzae TaxID=2487349 RepID=A0A3N4GCX7_9ACTN|nr:transposase [Gordonia oryzae]
MLKDVKNMSERMACKVVGPSRSAYRQLPLAQKPADPDAAVREQLPTYARKNPRHGFRRAWAHLRFDDGIEINKKKIHRLWKEEGLQVRRAPRRKRAGQSSVPIVVADAPKVVWALDFQFDSTVDGHRIKIASMVDEHTRMSLLNIVDRSIPGRAIDRGVGEDVRDLGWPAAGVADGQRPGVHLRGLAGVLCRVGGDLLYSARHAVEQRVHRVVQQPVARRVFEPQLLARHLGGPCGHRRLQG